MLEFLMYALENILSEDEFKGMMADFSIGEAQRWLDGVRDKIGVLQYEAIKDAFKEMEEERRTKCSEMNCSANRKTSGTRKTIFQIDIGAEKNVKIDKKDVDDMFLGVFKGI